MSTIRACGTSGVAVSPSAEEARRRATVPWADGACPALECAAFPSDRGHPPCRGWVSHRSCPIRPPEAPLTQHAWASVAHGVGDPVVGSPASPWVMGRVPSGCGRRRSWRRSRRPRHVPSASHRPLAIPSSPSTVPATSPSASFASPFPHGGGCVPGKSHGGRVMVGAICGWLVEKPREERGRSVPERYRLARLSLNRRYAMR